LQPKARAVARIIPPARATLDSLPGGRNKQAVLWFHGRAGLFRLLNDHLVGLYACALHRTGVGVELRFGEGKDGAA
jgi:hypothetical protein